MTKLPLFTKIGKKIVIFSFFIFLSLGLVIAKIPPASSQSITGINSEISSLRSRVSRLESAIRNLRGSNRSPSNNNSSTESFSNNPSIVNGRAIGSSDPFSERLATLIIELKEDIHNIEDRLVALENQQQSNK